MFYNMIFIVNKKINQILLKEQNILIKKLLLKSSFAINRLRKKILFQNIYRKYFFYEIIVFPRCYHDSIVRTLNTQNINTLSTLKILIYAEILSTTTIFNWPENDGKADNAIDEKDDTEIKPSIRETQAALFKEYVQQQSDQT